MNEKNKELIEGYKEALSFAKLDYDEATETLKTIKDKSCVMCAEAYLGIREFDELKEVGEITKAAVLQAEIAALAYNKLEVMIAEAMKIE